MFSMVPAPPASAGPDAALAGGAARDLLYRRQMPAWLLSFALHLTGLVALALVVPHLPQGAAEEPARTGGIVLVSRSAGPPQYLSEENAGGDLNNVLSEHQQNTQAGPQAQQESPEVPDILAGLLPQGSESVTGSDSVGDGADNATAMAGGAGPARGTGHNYAQTGVFGVQGTGSKFVYVFDRSGSMEGFQGRPLAAAKRELLASLQDLGSMHQFQIIFYNERPTILNPARALQPRMLFGSEQDKKIAYDFVRGILADGGTRHLDALKLALRMGPDVIFFLTDADEPALTNNELAEIRKLNERVGASINTIEFGSGPPPHRDNFLIRIARQNSGAHVYVDVSQLPRK
jgi:hypothetical protein